MRERWEKKLTSMGISYQLFINLSISLNTELSKNSLLEFRESSPKYFPGHLKIHYGITHSRNLAECFHLTQHMPQPGHDKMGASLTLRKKKQDWLRRAADFIVSYYMYISSSRVMNAIYGERTTLAGGSEQGNQRVFVVFTRGRRIGGADPDP